MADDLVIVDYGRGNLRSVQKAFEAVGARARVSGDPGDLAAPAMVLPGVGAFRDAMDNLAERGLVEPVMKHIRSGRPFLGVCLGLHLLLGEGEEFGLHPGLDVVSGRVVRFAPGKKIPHMGWNAVRKVKEEPLLAGIPDGTYFYFVHSYYARPADPGWVGGETTYGEETFASVLSRDNLFATQFHPEKSQAAGLRIYRNFLELARKEGA